jgi:hypothetical protein
MQICTKKRCRLVKNDAGFPKNDAGFPKTYTIPGKSLNQRFAAI